MVVVVTVTFDACLYFIGGIKALAGCEPSGSRIASLATEA